MTEMIASAVVPTASTPERGREVADFIRHRMGYNSERKNKKTGSKNYVEQVKGRVFRGGEGTVGYFCLYSYVRAY